MLKTLLQVLHEGVYSLDLSECPLGPEELGLLWRLCPRLKKLDIGLRRDSRDSLPSAGDPLRMICFLLVTTTRFTILDLCIIIAFYIHVIVVF